MRSYFRDSSSSICVIICWFLIGVSVLVFLNAFFGRNGLFSLFQDRDKFQKLKNEIVQLESSNKKLRAEIFSLKNNFKVVEKIARENLGLVKSGDTVFEFISSEEYKLSKE